MSYGLHGSESSESNFGNQPVPMAEWLPENCWEPLVVCVKCIEIESESKNLRKHVLYECPP